MATANISAPQPNPAFIFETLNAYQRSAALKAAIDLDLFTVIAAGNRTAETIAQAAAASARGVRILCDYLVICNFLLKQGNEYTVTPDAALFLDRNSQAYMGSVAGFLLDERVTAPFRGLADVVRTGRTTLPGEGTVSHDNPVWVEFARQMVPLIFPAAAEIAAMLASDGEMRVLDIAAGHGMFGILMAQRSPKAQITALDWPNVLAVASENAKRFGVAERHSLLPGDAFETEFGGPYDVVLVTNFFHHFDQPTCEKLMRKIRASLTPQGCCATLDFVPNDDRVSPPIAAGFAMTMLGTTAAGDAYTFAEFETMFRNAGYASSKQHILQKAPQTVIVSQA
ncbi:MAG: methyltransferase domain-containing protein [Acidobacteria bacterium]|nr:methyltransferase domain-containing protein [Acidobacteriota bacterium]